MGLRSFRAENFRCLGCLEFDPDPSINTITGPNAAGKTSVLEALYYLGRGRSFRSGGSRGLIRTGQHSLLLVGEVEGEGVSHRLGAEVRHGARTLRVDGTDATAADLAVCLPVQAIDPEIHQLIQGGPELRRRFLDWGVFHVEHSFILAWRRYQQALRQRNAALRVGAGREEVFAWNPELIAAAEAVDGYRQQFAEAFCTRLSSIISENLHFYVNCAYIRGWSEDLNYTAALEQSWDRDASQHITHVGPHRADLRLRIEDRQVRHRLSRGQQKMLGAAMVIAQTLFVIDSVQRELVLLVDDPSAELDRSHRRILFDMLRSVPAQLFVTALEADDLPWNEGGRALHMDRGEVVTLV